MSVVRCLRVSVLLLVCYRPNLTQMMWLTSLLFVHVTSTESVITIPSASSAEGHGKNAINRWKTQSRGHISSVASPRFGARRPCTNQEGYNWSCAPQWHKITHTVLPKRQICWFFLFLKNKQVLMWSMQNHESHLMQDIAVIVCIAKNWAKKQIVESRGGEACHNAP